MKIRFTLPDFEVAQSTVSVEDLPSQEHALLRIREADDGTLSVLAKDDFICPKCDSWAGIDLTKYAVLVGERLATIVATVDHDYQLEAVEFICQAHGNSWRGVFVR